MKTTENTRGRPSKLTDEKIMLAIKLRERGFSIEEIANSLGISEALLYLKNTEWAKLRERLNMIKSKQELERIGKVEKSLYTRAIGYKTKEKKESYDAEGNKTGEIITTRHIPADVKAQQFFLTNRAPDDWQLQPTENDADAQTDKTLKIKIED